VHFKKSFEGTREGKDNANDFAVAMSRLLS